MGLTRPYLVQGMYEEAEPLYHRAVTIAETTLGSGHPEYSVALNNLAELRQKQVWWEALIGRVCLVYSRLILARLTALPGRVPFRVSTKRRSRSIVASS